jgi:O-antigen ligase
LKANQPAEQRRPGPGDQARDPQGTSRTRRTVEQRSAAPLLFLKQLPAWLLPLVLVVLLIAGLALHGIGGALALCGVAVALGWLALLSWPRLSAGGRLGRAAVIVAVLVVAVIQAVR